MVADVLISHWLPLVAGEDAGMGGFGWAVQWPVALFYTQAGTSPNVAGFPDRIIQQVDPLDQRKQNGWGGVSYLLHCRRAIGGGIYTADDGRGSILLGASD